MRTGLALFAAALASLTGCAAAGPPVASIAPAQAEAQVRAALADLADAFSRGDGERAASHASTDLLLIHPSRGDVDHAEFTGIRNALKPYDGYKLTTATVDSLHVSGNFAVASITWRTVMRDRAGKETVRGERDQEVWRLELDGRWRLFRGASFPLPAPGYQQPSGG